MEKQLFSLKLLPGDFYGQSFIKTVRGPLACKKFRCETFQKKKKKKNNKGADQTVQVLFLNP